MTNGRTYDTMNTTKGKRGGEMQMRSEREEIMADIIRAQANMLFWQSQDDFDEYSKWEDILNSLQRELDLLS